MSSRVLEQISDIAAGGSSDVVDRLARTCVYVRVLAEWWGERNCKFDRTLRARNPGNVLTAFCFVRLDVPSGTRRAPRLTFYKKKKFPHVG